MRTLLYIITVIAVVSREITVKAPDFQHRFDQQLGQSRMQSYPIGYNEDIFLRQITAQGKADLFSSMCQQTPPTIKFGNKLSYLLNGQRRHQEIPMGFSDLHPRNKLINSKLIGEYVYILWGNGSLMIVYNYRTPASIQILPVGNASNIQKGIIITVERRVLIFADNQAYILDEGNVVDLEGLRGSIQPLSACSLSKGFLAVALGDQGVGIYRLYGNKLILKGTFNNQFFGINQPIFVADLATDGEDKLFVLDSKSGLLTIDISPLYNGRSTPNPPYNRTLKSDCQSILYNKGRVILACDQVYNYQVETNRVTEVFPKLEFKVKYMTAYNNLVIFKNGNLYRAYWYDRLIDFPQPIRGKQLILSKDYYIAIDDDRVLSAFYLVRPAWLTCQAPYNMSDEHIEVTIKTFGKCYQEYFQRAEVPTEFKQNDTCIYTTSAVINFWKGEDFDSTPIIVGSGFLVCVYSVLLLWMCIISLSQKSKELKSKNSIKSTEGHGSYKVISEKNGDNKMPSYASHSDSVQTSEVIMRGQDNTNISKRNHNVEVNKSRDSKQIGYQMHQIGN